MKHDENKQALHSYEVIIKICIDAHNETDALEIAMDSLDMADVSVEEL